jgi:hypothetical protein
VREREREDIKFFLIWSSYGDDCEEYGPPGCNAMQFGDSPTFWRNVASNFRVEE